MKSLTVYNIMYQKHLSKILLLTTPFLRKSDISCTKCKCFARKLEGGGQMGQSSYVHPLIKSHKIHTTAVLFNAQQLGKSTVTQKTYSKNDTPSTTNINSQRRLCFYCSCFMLFLFRPVQHYETFIFRNCVIEKDQIIWAGYKHKQDC